MPAARARSPSRWHLAAAAVISAGSALIGRIRQIAFLPGCRRVVMAAACARNAARLATPPGCRSRHHPTPPAGPHGPQTPHHRRGNPRQQPTRTRRRFHANATIPDEYGCNFNGVTPETEETPDN